MSDTTVTARALRRQIREWRRGRADSNLMEVIGDAYAAIFSTLILGSMLGSVLIHTGALTAKSCDGGPCQTARFWTPWLFSLAALALVGALARLFGPVFVSPATASWLLPTPVRRRPLLLPPLVLVTVMAGVVGAATALTATSVAGYGVTVVVAVTIGTALAGALIVGAWSLVQSAHAPSVLGAVLVWLPGLLLEAGLIATWRGGLHADPVPTDVAATGWLAVAGLALLAVCALALAVRRLTRLRDRDLTSASTLAPALSGALATLDLALVYDVVVGQRWRRHGHVRSLRGGPRGVRALVWPDVIRLRRSPGRLVLLLAAVPVPYAAKALGAGPVTAVIAVLAGFAAALPLLIGVRVFTRTPGLTRMLPFPTSTTRGAALVVPACCLLIYGALIVSATPAPVPIALAALASATRWVTGRPPDYGRPLVSTPAGAVPANLYGSALRGFDVAAITALPLLIPGGNGSTISMVISFVVLMVLVNRKSTS